MLTQGVGVGDQRGERGLIRASKLLGRPAMGAILAIASVSGALESLSAVGVIIYLIETTERLRLHKTLEYALYAVFLLHIGAVLQHNWRDRQPELQRMLPRSRRNKRSMAVGQGSSWPRLDANLKMPSIAKNFVLVHQDVGRLSGVSGKRSICDNWFETNHRFRRRFLGAAIH